MPELKRAAALLAIVAGVLTASTAAYGQTDTYLELLREDIKTQKVAILTEAMQFTDEQSTVFWPIYREYDVELASIMDRRVALIKDYAESYESMTDEKAKEIADRSFKIAEDRLKIRRHYYNRFEKELGATLAARFVQIENQIQLLIDLQIAAELPLIKPGHEGMDHSGH
jgi:hypothetical protein